MSKGNPRCPLCGRELYLGHSFAANEARGHIQLWHYYCECGLWFPRRNTPEEALAVTQRWKWPEQEEQVDEKRKP